MHLLQSHSFHLYYTPRSKYQLQSTQHCLNPACTNNVFPSFTMTGDLDRIFQIHPSGSHASDLLKIPLTSSNDSRSLDNRVNSAIGLDSRDALLRCCIDA